MIINYRAVCGYQIITYNNYDTIVYDQIPKLFISRFCYLYLSYFILQISMSGRLYIAAREYHI